MTLYIYNHSSSGNAYGHQLFPMVILGRVKRKKENRMANILQAWVIYFWTYLLGQENRIQYKPEEFILPVFKKTYCNLESCLGEDSTNKKYIIERVGATWLNFYFPWILLPLFSPPSLLPFLLHSLLPFLPHFLPPFSFLSSSYFLLW